MFGHVIWFNETSGKGRVRGKDSVEYFVSKQDFLDLESPRKGDRVEFEAVETSRGPRAQKIVTQVRTTETVQKFLPALKTKEGLHRYEAIQEAEEKRQKSNLNAFAAFGVALIVIGLLPNIPLGVSVFGALLGFCYFKGTHKKRMSKSAYYTIPHSKDEHRNHRCLACGAKGIYRSKPYQTDTTIADCSKCGLELWAEY
jgi:cold shock CspA family protein/predicted RNA-binding Zn-ribbon protein involved in translation (DUF1610 family)